MEQLAQFLLNNNWKEHKTEKTYPEVLRRLWCKPIDSTNEVGFDLYYSKYYIHETFTESLSLIIQTEIEGTWYMLQSYSMSIEHYITNASKLEEKLLRAWTNLHTN